ncbi:hypothetical protein DPEC_G00062950 [Dallia pectoralis]|uniref:Uncharacterized protein n=1 Tax=Dallia pectoralis TaxID=75939 RepID=A0ACC2H824_DALPE|nr:hypothetical protein DPEC_G00062950 [Dallia pectoralis]
MVLPQTPSFLTRSGIWGSWLETCRGFLTTASLEQNRTRWKIREKYTIRPIGMKKTGGRDHTGKIRTHGIGGGHKQRYRWIDFQRLRYQPGEEEKAFEEKVVQVRYDPCRSADIALVAGGSRKRWIIATENMQVGDLIKTSGSIGRMAVSANEGDSFPLGALPVGTLINNLELYPLTGATYIRAAGTSGVLLRKVNGTAIVQLPSKQQVQVMETCMVTVGRVSNVDHNKRIIGKAGRNRWLGIRPSSGLWQRKGGKESYSDMQHINSAREFCRGKCKSAHKVKVWENLKLRMEGKGVPKKGRPCQEPGKGKTFPIKIYKVLEAPAEDEPLEKPTNVKDSDEVFVNLVPVNKQNEEKKLQRKTRREYDKRKKDKDKDDIYVVLESLRHIPDRSDGTEETLPPTEQVDDVRKRDKAKKSNIEEKRSVFEKFPQFSKPSNEVNGNTRNLENTSFQETPAVSKLAVNEENAVKTENASSNKKKSKKSFFSRAFSRVTKAVGGSIPGSSWEVVEVSMTTASTMQPQLLLASLQSPCMVDAVVSV